jgi:hypothetical protein
LEIKVDALEKKRREHEAKLRVGRPWEADGISLGVVSKAEVGGLSVTRFYGYFRRHRAFRLGTHRHVAPGEDERFASKELGRGALAGAELM